MLILTVNINGNLNRYSFIQEDILIGKGDSLFVNISLPHENIHDQHIKITKQFENYIAVNMTNDPFATINGLPFGKKVLKDNDCIQLGNTSIIIDHISVGTPPVPSKEITLPDIPNDEQEPPFIDFEDSSSAEEIAVTKEKSDDELDNGVSSDFSISESSSIHSSFPPEEVTEMQNKDRPSVPFNDPQINDPQKKFIKTSKRKIILFLSVLVFISLFLVAIICYEVINDRSDESRLIAAEGVADVAMSLAYAQVNHIKPQKQNWMDPAFLTENLFSILSSEYPSFANIDNQGQFRNCPYLLRVYISNDLSQFLVIAQPNPSILQWLAPQPTILVDSNSMEMRTLEDLKVINRLLANSSTLDHTNGPEIIDSIKQGTLISLASLGVKKGFSPPKALTLFKPGAENRIYNAPRYYQFGESLLRDAMTNVNVGGESHEKTRLYNQIESLSRYADLVLYSSKGLHHAIQAQKALNEMYPTNRFLLAYLIFNSKGMVASSHLLFHNDTVSPVKEFIAENDTKQRRPMENSLSDEDVVHPLIIELKALKKDREKRLKSLGHDIETLLHENSKFFIKDFDQKLEQLIIRYQKENQLFREVISKKLEEIKNANINSDQLSLIEELKDVTNSHETDPSYTKLKGVYPRNESNLFVTLSRILGLETKQLNIHK